MSGESRISSVNAVSKDHTKYVRVGLRVGDRDDRVTVFTDTSLDTFEFVPEVGITWYGTSERDVSVAEELVATLTEAIAVAKRMNHVIQHGAPLSGGVWDAAEDYELAIAGALRGAEFAYLRGREIPEGMSPVVCDLDELRRRVEAAA